MKVQYFGQGISQSQDDSLTVGEVQLSPGDDRLQSLSNEDFLAPTNSNKTCVTVQLVYMKHLCLCKNNMKSDVFKPQRTLWKFNFFNIMCIL